MRFNEAGQLSKDLNGEINSSSLCFVVLLISSRSKRKHLVLPFSILTSKLNAYVELGVRQRRLRRKASVDGLRSRHQIHLKHSRLSRALRRFQRTRRKRNWISKN